MKSFCYLRKLPEIVTFNSFNTSNLQIYFQFRFSEIFNELLQYYERRKDNFIRVEHVDFIISEQTHVFLFFLHCVNLLTAAGSIVVKVVNN